jgi:hypothetical protein
MRTTVGEQFARALAAKDSERMRALLADPIDFQGLTPGRYWQAASPEKAIEEIILGVWFGPSDDIHELRAVNCGQVADRERVSYRLGVRRNGTDYVVEQQAYYNSDGERITWIRILCSGYRPEGVKEPEPQSVDRAVPERDISAIAHANDRIPGRARGRQLESA